ncbi:MAG: class E sortase [Patescibacteria group bacterium]|nr:class E sortase [Patescibacteria group bacterium]
MIYNRKINFKKEEVIRLTNKKPKPKDEAFFAVQIRYVEENFKDDLKKLWPKIINLSKNKKVKKIITNRYFKKASLFLGIYFAIYFLLSSPMYYERLKFFIKGTKKVKVITQEVVTTPMANSAPLEAGETIPDGTFLVIPKIDINIPIISIDGIDEDIVQDNLRKGVVKLGGTAAPGEVGNTFIIGHSSGYFWDNNPYKYVFVLLDKMEIGDTAKIYTNKRKITYEVIEKKVVDPTQVDVVKQTDEPYLTLMTCYPPGTTNQRLIVKMKQTQPAYVKPKVVTKEKEVEVPKTLPSVEQRSFLDRILFFWK